MPTDSKPLLIFKHNPKAAGGTLLIIFKELKSNRISNDDFAEGTIEKHIDIDQSFIEVEESAWLNPSYQQRGFVISSTREPCSHLVSLWSFASNGNGGMINANNIVELFFRFMSTFVVFYNISDKSSSINYIWFNRWMFLK